MRKWGLLGILVIILMTACSGPVEGIVVGKDVDPGRTETYRTTERRSCGTENYTVQVNGKSQTRSRTKYCDYPITRTKDIPARWQLNIRTDKGSTQWVTVSRLAYERTKIGERVNTGSMN